MTVDRGLASASTLNLSGQDDLAARLKAACATPSPNEYAQMQPIWEGILGTWAGLRGDLGDAPTSLVFVPLPIDE